MIGLAEHGESEKQQTLDSINPLQLGTRLHILTQTFQMRRLMSDANSIRWCK